MTNIKIKPITNKEPKNIKEAEALIQQEHDIIQASMYERFKGQAVILRSNFALMNALKKEPKALDKFKTKYPELYLNKFAP